MIHTAHCKYHQNTPARWYCRSCGITFCSQCVNDQLYDDPPQCALCNEPLSDMGFEGIIPPFWHKIPLFFKIPASLSAIIVMGFLIGLGYIASWVPVIGWLVLLLVIPVIYLKYCYLTLQTIASGEMRAPDLKLLLQDSDYGIVFKQLGILFVLFAPTADILQYNRVLGILWYLFILFLIPATVMVLSVEKSFFKAVNPFLLLSFVQRIGFSYIGLYLLIAIISGGPMIILEIVIGISDFESDKISDYIYLFIIFAILQMYFNLVIFSIMGYVLLRFHYRLGYQVDAPIEALFGKSANLPKIHPLLKDVEVLARENRPIDALKRLQTRLDDNASDLILRMRFHRMLFTNNRYPAMLEHARSLIPLALSSNDKAQAVEVYHDCLEADKDYVLTDLNLYLPLAQTMLKVRQYQLIIRLLNRFHLQHPQYPQLTELYLILARALSDGLNNDEKALTILDFLLQQYPEASNKQAIIQYRQSLKKLVEVKKT
jgi:hypothetical protein